MTLIIVIAVLASFYVAGGLTSFNLGLYGVGLASVGMLATLGITLSTDAEHSIADSMSVELPKCHINRLKYGPEQML